VRLHTSQQEGKDNDLEQENFMSHKEVASAENISNAPKHCNNKIGGKKFMLPLPRAVINQDKK